MTNMGADTILNILGRRGYGNDDDNGYGNAYCYEADDYDINGRFLSSDSGDENSISGTMGCSMDNEGFAMAVFEGSYCDGNYFLNETDPMDDYNSAMNSITCAKIWDGSSNFDGDELLMTSSACDGYAYQGRCADPYGLKQRYEKLLGLGGSSRSPVTIFFRAVSWIALFLGLSLMGTALYLRRKYGKKRRRRRRKRKKQHSDSNSVAASDKSDVSLQYCADISEASHEVESHQHHSPAKAGSVSC